MARRATRLSPKALLRLRQKLVDEGLYEDDKPHGEGQFSYKNGTVYKGEIVQGKRHGNGKLFVIVNKEGDERKLFEGIWKDDEPASPSDDLLEIVYGEDDMKSIS